MLKTIKKWIPKRWLAITCVFTLMGDNAFINGAIRMGNVLFYIWFVTSVLALVKIYKKMWNSKSLEHLNL